MAAAAIADSLLAFLSISSPFRSCPRLGVRYKCSGERPQGRFDGKIQSQEDSLNIAAAAIADSLLAFLFIAVAFRRRPRLGALYKCLRERAQGIFDWKKQYQGRSDRRTCQSYLRDFTRIGKIVRSILGGSCVATENICDQSPETTAIGSIPRKITASGATLETPCLVILQSTAPKPAKRCIVPFCVTWLSEVWTPHYRRARYRRR